jgi:FixJ family two-component response regulator
MSDRQFVTVIDDDESIRDSLPDLLGELGYETVAFKSPEMFLSSGVVSKTECLILDINMPGISGLDLQNKLKDQRLAIRNHLHHGSERRGGPCESDGTGCC